MRSSNESSFYMLEYRKLNQIIIIRQFYDQNDDAISLFRYAAS